MKPSPQIAVLQHQLTLAIWQEATSRGMRRKAARDMRETVNRLLLQAAGVHL